MSSGTNPPKRTNALKVVRLVHATARKTRCSSTILNVGAHPLCLTRYVCHGLLEARITIHVIIVDVDPSWFLMIYASSILVRNLYAIIHVSANRCLCKLAVGLALACERLLSIQLAINRPTRQALKIHNILVDKAFSWSNLFGLGWRRYVSTFDGQALLGGRELTRCLARHCEVPRAGWLSICGEAFLASVLDYVFVPLYHFWRCHCIVHRLRHSTAHALRDVHVDAVEDAVDIAAGAERRRSICCSIKRVALVCGVIHLSREDNVFRFVGHAGILHNGRCSTFQWLALRRNVESAIRCCADFELMFIFVCFVCRIASLACDIQ
mmetsp:Transcript_151683/g.264299  ORF Transcript_151683/g.264299 Transcript_151683/m.264299 type:complete len:324 (-) Transcript_151683:2543-3514(-)